MSLEVALDKLAEALTARIIKKMAETLPSDLSSKVKSELLRQEKEISASVERYLISAVVRHIMRILVQNVDSILAQAIRDAVTELPFELRQKIKAYVKQELRRVILHLKTKFERERRVSATIKQEQKLSEEVEARLRQMSDLVAKFFNLMLKFEPRFHILPFLQEMREATIDELSSFLSMRRDDIIPFLKELEKAGFVRIRGNVVTLIREIFPS